MSALFEHEMRRITREEVSYHPMVANLQTEIMMLKQRLDNMERCCVCVKINAPAKDNDRQTV